MPSTAQGNVYAETTIFPLTENLTDESDSFPTQQLFSFAWQVARGMVMFDFTCRHLENETSFISRTPNSFPWKKNLLEKNVLRLLNYLLHFVY